MKLKNYIAVVFYEKEEIYVRFVTGISDGNIARWERNKDAMQFSHEGARDIVEGLLMNGYRAGIFQSYTKVSN